MEVIAAVAARVLGSISGNISGAAMLSAAAENAVTMSGRLTSVLSPEASVYFPGSEGFTNASMRWSSYDAPGFSVAVQVATESDAQQTVKLANTLGLPFLAITGQHGSTSGLGQMDYGFEIYMRKLNSVEIQEDGQTAVIGGGVLTKELSHKLWASGKQTVSGVCECTSLTGPMLGGGHGWLQGKYGLAIDNIVEARVVLANGSLVTASETLHPDLFWGLRGAGHNFGIVTSVKYKIYDVPENNMWTVGTYIYTRDKLEIIFKLLNELTDGGNQPAELLTWLYYVNMPDVDPENVVLAAYLLYEGTEEEASPYSARFEGLGPAVSTSVAATYLDLPRLTMQSEDAFPCQKASYRAQRMPIGLKEYNTTAQQAAYDIFNAAMKAMPGLNNSLVINEGYAVGVVKAVPAESTAFPDRFNNLLLATFMMYYDPLLDEAAREVGVAIRKALVEGSGSSDLYAYVNYALGDETVADMYGHEAWRVEKLTKLKAEYDPQNRFGFYAPIV